MKKRTRKILASLLAVVMSVGLLAGCGSSSSSSSSGSSSDTSSAATEIELGDTTLDISETVEIIMYVVSDEPAGQDTVMENLNELLLEKLNCTLTINWIAWSDYANKYPLLFSSGEEFDMVYTSTWLNWTQLASKGAFMELDDLWPTYAPDNYANTTEEAIAQATLEDGHIYVVPTQLATYTDYGPIYRTVFDDGQVYEGEITDIESMEEYLAWVKENEPDLTPYDVYSEGSIMDDVWMYANGYYVLKDLAGIYFNVYDEDPQLITMYQYDGVTDFLEMMNRWNEAGYFSKSALADTDSTKTQNGLAALKLHNIDTYVEYYVMHPDWGFEYTSLTDPISHLPYTQDSMAISNTSQNPERAMALWNLITTDQEVYDAFYYGVLGTTYELNEEGQFSITDSDLYSTSAMWAARTTELNRDQDGAPNDLAEVKQGYEDEIEADDAAEKYTAFVVDLTEIETEYAAVQNVLQQYWRPLELGYTDMESGLAEFQEKMEAAGIDTILEVVQEQLDEYVAGLE